MKIDRKLNLVLPLETESGTIYIHSSPFSREAWTTYFLILSKVYTAIFNEGLSTLSGPSVAALMLRNLAKSPNEDVQRAQTEFVDGLLNEVRRLTNVIAATPTGWKTLMLEDALRQGIIDQDAYAEAENQIVFFIAASGVLRGPQSRGLLTVLMTMVESTWRLQTTLLTPLDYANSLPISMPAENTGAKMPASSVPH